MLEGEKQDEAPQAALSITGLTETSSSQAFPTEPPSLLNVNF